MDFDGGKRKDFVNWKYEEKDMKNLRTAIMVLGPAITLCFLFSVNVIKLGKMTKAPSYELAKVELRLVEDTTNTWYNQLAKVELKNKSLAKR